MKQAHKRYTDNQVLAINHLSKQNEVPFRQWIRDNSYLKKEGRPHYTLEQLELYGSELVHHNQQRVFQSSYDRPRRMKRSRIKADHQFTDARRSINSRDRKRSSNVGI